jgi:phospholipid transport system substrate-binding protein
MIRGKGIGQKRSACAPVRALAAFVAAILAGAILVSAPAWAAPNGNDEDALKQTKALVDQALGVLRDRNLSLAQERQQLRALADAHFDFRDMARSALGYHWRDLSEDQRQQFVKLFTAFIEDAYLNRIQEYEGQDIEFVSQKSEGDGYVTVDSRVVGANMEHPVDLQFRLKQNSPEWKIYDVTVDAISITANYRNQFNRVINNQGFDKLMADLQAKQAQLAADLGKR